MTTRRSGAHSDAVIERFLQKRDVVTTGDLVEATGLSRQAVHKRLRRLVAEGRLFFEGAGRGARYVTRRTQAHLRRPIAGLDEAELFVALERLLPELAALPKAAANNVHYAFTELVNNAVDHSGAKQVECRARLFERHVEVEIVDEGVGAFESVRRRFRLASHLEALAEISKGKTTTDPERHSGQGIFFASKAVDLFVIESGAVRWVIDNRMGDMAVGACERRVGTCVRYEVDRDTRRNLRKIFDDHTTDVAFDKTRTIVRLFAHGTAFVSRSEAKRLLSGLEKFREVVLDFAGVDTVGQGFVDEVFRVWARAHEDTRLLPVDMLEPVAFMVQRALAEATRR